MNVFPAIAAASPGEPAYSAATAAYNLLPQPTPARTVIARSVEDVQSAVHLARELGLQVSVMATGHSIATSQPLDHALLVRTELDGNVEIDVERQTATFPAGTRWASVATAAGAHGLAALHGSSGTVGAIGYLLRGGISFYGRAHGVAANSLESLQVVLADGSVATASRDENADLFWAIRGGGGGFGVVTSATIRLEPMWKVLTGIAIWDAEHAAELLSLWRTWAKNAPVEVTTSLRILNLPPLPGIPPEIAGRTVVALDGAACVRDPYLLGDMTHAVADLLDPLRAHHEPLIDTWDVREPVDLLLTHMDPPDPLPFVGDHMLLDDLDDDDLRALVELVGTGSGSALTAVELRQLGGAFAHPRRSGGAFDRTSARFALLVVGAVGGPLTAELQLKTAARLRDALRHRDTGFTLPTFVESAEQPSRTFDDEQRRAVELIRRTVDPDGLFTAAVVPFVEGSR